MSNNINRNSMIVALNTGLPRQSTKLKKEAAEIEEKAHAESGIVKASVNYFRRAPDKSKGETGRRDIDGLEALKDYQYEYKGQVRSLARYPYAGDFYLAPAAVIEQLLRLRDKYEGDEGVEVRRVAVRWGDREYNKWYRTAEKRMGALFKEDDFPSLSECIGRFKCEMILLPLGEKEQVARIALIAPKTQQFLARHADEASRKAVEELHKQIWEDLMKPLQQVVTVFEKDKGKVYETLLPNLMEIVNVIPSYQELTQDAELARAAERVRETLGRMTTEDLRSSDEARRSALTSARNIITEFTPFARRFS